MFETLTTSRKASSGTSMFVSLLLHGLVIALAAALTYARAHMPKTEEPVAVTFRTAPPPPPPPPPPAGHKPKTPRQTPKVPITPKPRPQIVQPKEPPKPEEKPPEDSKEDEPDEDEGGVEGGVVGGVLGGVVGGVLGGKVGGVVEAPQPKGPVEFNDAMTPPSVLSGPNPEYTQEAIDHEVEGLMVVKCIVSLQGIVHNCRVLQGLPFMDRQVVETLQRRRYSPALQQGKPIEVDYTFRIRLTLPQ